MPTKKKPLNRSRLRRIVDEIEGWGARPGAELIRHLQDLEKLRVAEVPKGSGIYRVTMAGISAQSTGGAANALANWANKARRDLNATA